MSPVRPDLVECWIFRVSASQPEFLLLRRAPGRIFPGLWQCVTGAPETGERIPQAALREVAEETGFGAQDIEGFYDLDMVSSFYDQGPDAIVLGAIFALRVRPEADVHLSHEHDAYRWAALDEARALAVWPSYAECLDRVRARLIAPADASWFELDLDGHRSRR